MLWMLLYPLTELIGIYVLSKSAYELKNVKFFGFISVVTWFVVGYLLYER